LAKWIIFGTLVNLSLIVTPGLGQAVSPEPAVPQKSSSIWEANALPPLLSPRYNRFEPASLPERLAGSARQYLKTPYRRGSSLQTGKATDCSGFVQYLYRKADVRLPRVSAAQAQVGTKVEARPMDFSKLQTGDLLFFRDGRRYIGHVGLYLGDGKMIHASSHARGVAVADLHQPYFRGNFVVAKRLLNPPKPDQVSAARILGAKGSLSASEQVLQ
jgi:cell wall-associated NlpC family hydrolase